MSLVIPDEILQVTRMSAAELSQEIAVLLFQSNRDGRALKRRERQAGKVLIVSRTEVSQNADSHRLAEFEPLNNVRPPMDPSGITAKADVGGELVQFPTHRERRPCIGQKREPIGAGHHRIGDDKSLVEKRFEDGDAGPHKGRVSGRIRWMGRTPFGIGQG